MWHQIYQMWSIRSLFRVKRLSTRVPAGRGCVSVCVIKQIKGGPPSQKHQYVTTKKERSHFSFHLPLSPSPSLAMGWAQWICWVMAWTDQSSSRVSHVWETENIRPGRGFSGLMYDRWAAAGALMRTIWASRLLSQSTGGAERMRGGTIAGPNRKKEENTPLFLCLMGRL